jgi:hypothetical protein
MEAELGLRPMSVGNLVNKVPSDRYPSTWSHAAAAGVRRLTDDTLASNARILHFARTSGFSIMPVRGAPGYSDFRETSRRNSRWPRQAGPHWPSPRSSKDLNARFG